MTTTNKEFEVKHGLVVAATTSATSTTTGSIVAKGGAGIAENLYVGGNLFVTGTVSSTSSNATSVTVNNDTSTASTHYLTFVSVSAGEGAIKVDNSDLFYQPSTGSLGVGTSTFTRKFAVNGTAEITDNLFLTKNENATSASTGALRVTGGVGIAQDLYVGGNTTLGDSVTDTVTINGKTTIEGLSIGTGAGNVSTNTALGVSALSLNSTGNNNTAVGRFSLSSNTIGASNTAVGSSSLRNNTQGFYNTAVGSSSLFNNTTGSSNTGIGDGSLSANTDGTNNTAIGNSSLNQNINGSNNTAVGLQALRPTTGSNNIGIGYLSGNDLVTGSNNVIIGSNTGSTINGLSNRIIISDGAGNIRISVDNNGQVTIPGELVVTGNLIVNGTTTTVNSSTLTVDDKNIELGSVTAVTVSATGTVGSISGTGPWTATITGMTSTTGLIVGSAISATNGTGSLGAAGAYIVASIVSSTSITFTATGGTTPTAGTVTNIATTGATDITANGGGITLKGATDKTISWLQSSGRWTFNQPVEATSIQNTPIGSTTATTGRFTTVESTIPTGTAPLIVASTTVVSNLNADLLDGNHASAFYAFGTLTLDNTDSGYTWVTTDNTNVVADALSDTLKIVQGTGLTISVDATNDAIKFAHADTSSVANLSSDNSSNTFIQDVSFTFDEFGHVTAASVATGTVSFTGINTFSSVGVDNSDTEYTWVTTDTSTVAAEATSDTLTLVAGLGIDLATDATNDAIRITHEDTSSVANVTAATNKFISGITFDGFGHVATVTTGDAIAFSNVSIDNTDTEYTWVTTDGTTAAAESISDTLKIVAGGAIQVAADATNDAIRIAHSDTSTVADLSSDNTGNTFIQDISFTFDTYGHVTGASVATGTISFATINTFSTVTIDNTDTEYTWVATDGTSVVADATADTLKIVAGAGIDVAADATNDAIRITHEDTSTAANLVASAGTFVSGLTFDTFGHVTGYSTSSGASVTISDTPPASPYSGALWWHSTQGTLKVYYQDGDSNQWVDAVTVKNGTNGVGVPAGGSTGQYLVKTSATDYATAWQTLDAVTVTGTQTLTNKTITGLKGTRVTMAANNIDLNAGNYFTKTISVPTTFTLSNVPVTGTTASFILEITNGGSQPITWWSNIRWPGGVAPLLTGVGLDILSFYTHDAGANWIGLLVGEDVK